MPTDAHLQLAFGADTKNCDMLVFVSAMETANVFDCYNYEKDPENHLDVSQDWTAEIIDYGSRRNKLFTARRALDTGDANDFAIQLDREMVISYFFANESSKFERNDFSNRMALLFTGDGQTTKGWDALFGIRRVPEFENHGIWMFLAWMPLGYLLLATKRYLKSNWKVWHVVHIVIGLVTMVLTIWQTLEISLRFGWGLTDDPHSILGTICIGLTLISVFTGTIAAAYMRYYNGDKEWSGKERATIIGKLHRWTSYFVLFYANVIILGGTITYCLTYLKE